MVENTTDKLLILIHRRITENEDIGCEIISNTRPLPTFAGRSIGIVVLVFVQSLIGVIHIFFGLWLLSASAVGFLYNLYTTVFGVVTLFFAFGFWIGKSWGWLGTVSALLFVTIADVLTLLNLPSMPGIPKFAAFAEIIYSLILLLYLFQPHIRDKARTVIIRKQRT